MQIYRRIILLDRNAVSIAKKGRLKNSELYSMQRDRQEEYNCLLKLDRPANIISPIFSICEGESGYKESGFKVLETLKKETAAISDFFRKAKSDSNVLLNNSAQFTEIFSDPIELLWDSYKQFLSKVHSIICRAQPKKDRKHHESKIISLARDYEINPCHPIVVCCLAALYGNNVAKRILKFNPNKSIYHKTKDRQIYNALSDLLSISRTQHIQALANKKRQSKKSINVTFFTLDKNLKEFAKYLDIQNTRISKDGTNYITFTWEYSIFSELSKGEAEGLLHMLAETTEIK